MRNDARGYASQRGERNYGNRFENRDNGLYSRSSDKGFPGQNLQPIKHENLKPIKKDLYQEHPSVSKRPQSEVDRYLAENQVTLQGQGVPRPILEFEESTFPEPIKKPLREFSKPTVIQAISWPIALSGRDTISIAKTGSGKTLGFTLPAIMHILNQPPRVHGDGPIALVLLPTRELAQQVEVVAKKFCDVMKLSIACCFGGAPRGPQAGALRRGLDMLVGTPGRILDFLESGAVNMRRCSFLVLDEADRMLDMGFEPQIRKVVGQIRPDRQTLLFSATWPNEIRKLAADFQNNPVFLNVGSTELAANHKIKQHVEVIENFAKRSRLYQLLKEIMAEPDHKTIIFVGTKKVADYLTGEMRRGGFSAFALHGGKAQRERDWVMGEFRASRAKILIATDVAARGLDLDDIKVVINYDYPNDAEDYVHRIGRTARGGKKGTAYTFFSSVDGANRNKAEKLISVLEEAKQNVPEALKQFLNGFRGSKGNTGYGRNSSSASKRSYGISAHHSTAAKKTRFDDHGSSYSHGGKGNSHASYSTGHGTRW